MDRFIGEMSAEQDDDLMLCRQNGVAYQANMKVTAVYDESYFGKCRGYEGHEIALAINSARIALVERHHGARVLLDVGIGSGEFIKRRPATYGFDINPAAVAWLREKGLFWSDIGSFPAFTFWDVIEHIPVPEDYFGAMKPGSYVFASLPIFDDLSRIRKSKHYRPGEHLYYFTREGFAQWMGLHGFALLEVNDAETDAGRESIGSFALRKR